MPQTTKKGYFAIAYIKEDQSWQKEGELHDAIVAVFNANPIWNDNCEQVYASHDEITERIKEWSKERENNAEILIAIWVAHASKIKCFPKDPWILDRLEYAMLNHLFSPINAFGVPHISVQGQPLNTETRHFIRAMHVAYTVQENDVIGEAGVEQSIRDVAGAFNISYETARAAYYLYRDNLTIDETGVFRKADK